MPKFYNKDASLTDYALSCGYVEKTNDITIIDSKQTYNIELYKEHGCYHVRKFRCAEGGQMILWGWESFDNITESRKCYKRNGGQHNVAAMQSYNDIKAKVQGVK